MGGTRPTGQAPLCPGPDPAPHGPTRFKAPPGAVDTHAHVIGLPPAYPFVEGRAYTPPEATAKSYLNMLDKTGMSHGVLIQISVHGSDNRLMVETLHANPQRLRGVAVIAPDRPDAEYRALAEAGVVGLRLNLLYAGGIGLDALERTGALCKEMGWHLQFLADARHLPELAPRLSKLPVPFIFDHMGHFPTTDGMSSPCFQTLLGLVRDGAWVKLSGAYRTSVARAPYADTLPFARAFIRAAPSRCVWGSDWPHVDLWDQMMNVSDLLDLLADWGPDEAVRRAILVDNPARLYGFKPPP